MTEAQHHHRSVTACPAPALLAAYADGVTETRTRASIETHLADCADCRDVLQLAAGFGGDIEPARRGGPVRVIVLGAALLAIAATLIIAVRGRQRAPGYPSEIAPLVAAMGSTRTFEPRLVGGFAYGAAPVTTRGAASSAPRSPDVRIAAAEIEKRLNSRRSAVTLHANGAALLVLGDSDGAITALEDAARLSPGDPGITTDLSAAYLVHVGAGHPEDTLRAVDAASRAAGTRDPPLEALFNHALALEAAHLRIDATRAWEAYLVRDGASPWADEARRHLALLRDTGAIWEKQRPLFLAAVERGDLRAIDAAVGQFPFVVREYLEDELLPAWGHAAQAGSAAAARLLDSAGHIARRLADLTGDRLDLDAITHVHLSRGAASDGFVAYGQARASYKQAAFAAAAEPFRRAEQQLRQAGNAFASRAAYYVITQTYRDGDLTAADAALVQLIDLARTRQYRDLEGHCWWIRGLVAITRGQYTAAIGRYRSAQDIFSRTRDRGAAAAIHTLVAETLGYLGQSSEAWREWLAGLGELDASIDSRTWGASLLAAANQAEVDGAWGAATDLETEALTVHTERRHNSGIIEARLRLSVALRERGDLTEARSELAATRMAIQDVTDPWLRRRYEAEADVIDGRLLSAEGQPQRALEPLARAKNYFLSVRATFRTGPLELWMGRAAAAAGDPAAASRHYAKGIELFEQIRGGLTGAETRIAYSDANWQLFDESIRLDLATGRTDDAFATSERARARSLIDAWHVPAQDAVLTPLSLAAALPRGVCVVSYYRLGDSYAAWVVTGGQPVFFEWPAHLDLEASVRDLLAASTHTAARALYSELWRPIAAAIPARSRVVVIPARGMQTVPFAALETDSRRFLIEEHEISLAPSAAMLIAATGRLAASAPPRWLLAIGSAAPRPDLPALQPLADTTREIGTLVRLYPHAWSLIDAQATRPPVMTALPQADVIHFAGHSLISRDYPFLSRLILAPSSDDEQDLYASEIGALKLPHTRLVVLAACSTGTGRDSAGEGALSLARPFIAAGVPTVVASLADVEDGASAALMRHFHREYARSWNAASALRDAQLRLLHGSETRFNAPAAWASFAVFGGIGK